MLKRALFASAVLVIPAMFMQGAVTPAFAGQIQVQPKVSVKPKPPRVRVIRPKVRIRIDTNRLNRRGQESNAPPLTQPSGTPAGDIPAPGTDTVDAPNTPTLDVSDGVSEIFRVFGGVVPPKLEDLPGAAAFPGYFPGWIPGNELPGGGSFSPQRIAVGNEGPFRAGGGLENPGHAASGWRLTNAGGTLAATATQMVVASHRYQQD